MTKKRSSEIFGMKMGILC